MGDKNMHEIAPTWVDICALEAIPEGEMHNFKKDEKWIVVYRVAGQFYATDNVCPHEFALLSEGWLENGIIECPLHGALFDIKTGNVIRGPAACGIRTYPVRIEAGRILCAV
jgi:nitrite reductase/ring-hydroxylating ferredoxin subunit